MRIAKTLVTVYKVTPRPRKYKFKLTVYDKEDDSRIDTDVVIVEIPEGKLSLHTLKGFLIFYCLK